MDLKEPRTWFYALMDAGVELKKARKGVNRRSKHYTQQSAFIGSRRQVRAAVLKLLTQKGARRVSDLCRDLSFEKERIEEAIEALCRDGFLVAVGRGRYSLQ
jgi:A/G-specific adenine glycosylase